MTLYELTKMITGTNELEEKYGFEFTEDSGFGGTYYKYSKDNLEINYDNDGGLYGASVEISWETADGWESYWNDEITPEIIERALSY